MKKILIIFSCAYALLISCNRNRPQIINRTTGRDLTASEKKFIPYQQNDTCSFSNGKGGLLSYTCTQRTDARYDIKLTSCGPKDDYCDIHNEEILEVNLACSNTIYNVKFKIFDNGSSFTLYFYNQLSGGDSFYRNLFADSLCPLTYYCLDSVTINNKKYYKVGKLVDIQHINQNIDTLYYTASNGILRFCMSDSTVWTKR